MGVRRFALIAGAVVAASAMAAVPASAAPTPCGKATGVDDLAIAGAVDAFEEEVGTVNCQGAAAAARSSGTGCPTSGSTQRSCPRASFAGRRRAVQDARDRRPGSADDNLDMPPFADPDQIDFSGDQRDLPLGRSSRSRPSGCSPRSGPT